MYVIPFLDGRQLYTLDKRAIHDRATTTRPGPHRSLGLQPPSQPGPVRVLTLIESSTVERPVRRVELFGSLIHENRRAA